MERIKQNRTHKKRRRFLPVHAYLSYLLICSLLLTGMSFSKYISTASGSDSSRVAAGIVNVSSVTDTVVELSCGNVDDIKTGEFRFLVSNSGSEVAIRYDLVVKVNERLPAGVTIKLYKEGNAMPIATFVNSGSASYTVSDAGIFEAGKKAVDNYTLFIESDFNMITSNYESDIDIVVRGEQID